MKPSARWKGGEECEETVAIADAPRPGDGQAAAPGPAPGYEPLHLQAE
eukprot:gene3939-4305_t